MNPQKRTYFVKKKHLFFMLLTLLFAQKTKTLRVVLDGKIFKVPRNLINWPIPYWPHFPEKNIKDPKQRISSDPYITADTFRNFCDHIVDETNVLFDPSTVETGDTIYTRTHSLDFFFEYLHPHIKSPYILVTHFSDLPIPGKYYPYLDDKKLVAWFGINVVLKHKKLYPLPVGLTNNFYSFIRCPRNTTISETIDSILHKFSCDRPEKRHLLLLPSLGDTHIERKKVKEIFSTKEFCKKAEKKPFKEYLEDMAYCKFILSPQGIGLDCHRTWEALLMGCIPIVSSSPIDNLFDDLPVLIIQNWNQITKKFLEEKYMEMSQKKYNLEKIYIYYWLDKIKEVQTAYRNKEGK